MQAAQVTAPAAEVADVYGIGKAFRLTDEAGFPLAVSELHLSTHG
ncbi:hypothetical protein C4J83_1459 [Pseudomonas sp. LBUM920]|nr:hypothetical protein C4J83_1459 [Pseudomonas sp. LBUM920]